MKPAKGDIAKVRSIFTWIAAKSTSDLEQDEVMNGLPQDSPLVLLRDIIAQKRLDWFSDLFANICKAAGIPCRPVRGLVKAGAEEPGDPIRARNTYNIVLVGGEWRFIHQSWGSFGVEGGDTASQGWEEEAGGGEKEETGKTDGAGGGPSKVVYIQDDFWFLTDPEVMAHFHLDTDNPALQLLPRPITENEFQYMAVVEESFFDLGLRSLSQSRCRLEADDGEVSLNFGLPDDKSLEFTYVVYKSTQDTNGQRNGNIPLRRLVLMERCTDDGVSMVKVTLQLPWIGKYKFELRGREERSDDAFNQLCEYVIICTTPKFDLHVFPVGDSDEWGPAPGAEEVGLKQDDGGTGFLKTEDGTAELGFHLDDAQKKARFHYTIENERISQKELSGCIRHVYIEDRVVFRIRVPSRGYYVIKLHVEAHETSERTLFARYLLYAARGFIGQTAKPVDGVRIGRQSRPIGAPALVPVSHPDPEIDAADGEVTIVTRVEGEGTLDVTHDLTRDDQKGSLNEYVLKTWDEDRTSYHIKFANVGVYHFKLYEDKGSDQHTKYETDKLYHYIITVDQPIANCQAFPELSSDWSDGYAVIAPLERYLSADTTVQFVIKVPAAERVVVAAAGELASDLLEGDGDDTWTADIYTGDPGEMKVLVVAPGDKHEQPILTYSVVDRFEAESLTKSQQRAEQEARRLKQTRDAKREAEQSSARARREKRAAEVKRKKDDFEKNRDKYEEAEKHLEEKQEQEEQSEDKKKLGKSRKSRFFQNKGSDPVACYRVMKSQMALERLREAMRRREVDLLERSIAEARHEGVPDNDIDLMEAERELEIVRIRNSLKTARHTDEIGEIQREVDAIASNRWHLSRLQREVQEAEMHIEMLERLQNLKRSVLEMDKKTMSEIRRYHNPPVVVHRVLQGAMLLLKEDEEKTSDWRYVQRLLNPQGLQGMNRKIMDFNAASVHPDIAARARYILEYQYDEPRVHDPEFDPCHYGLEKVQSVSSGAGTFYVWAMGMLKEVEGLNKGCTGIPAHIRRQKEIFDQRPGNASPQRKRKF